MYDNAEYLNVSNPTNLSPEEQLDVITDTAKVSLAEVEMWICVDPSSGSG